MRVEFLKSSTLIIESGGVRVLTDPWLVDGEYYGSWFHVPPYDGDIPAIKADYIYISHIHPDHMGSKTLERLDKSIPVLIHKFPTSFLRESIERFGFNVIELDHDVPTSLGDAMEITIYSADNCDPELCGRFLGCSNIEKNYMATQIDTLALFDDGAHRVLNTNDCPYGLSKVVVDRVLERVPGIDLLLVGYAGAGPFPQCFYFDDPAEQRLAAERKRQQFLDQAMDYIAHVNPRYYMPYAGTYTLGGRYHVLNDLRGVPLPEEALGVLRENCATRSIASEGVLLDTGAHIDLDSGAVSQPYTNMDLVARAAYIESIADAPYDYDGDPMPTVDEILSYMPDAYKRFCAKCEEIVFETDTRLSLGTDDNKSIVITPGEGWLVTDQRQALSPPYLHIDTDTRLLLRLLKGPKFAHWNNAEVGSHLRYRRDPDVFERGLYHCLCYLHV